MLDQATRSVILELRRRGHGVRQIARTLQISRGAVRKVLSASSAQVPRIEREEKAEPYRDQILELFGTLQGQPGARPRRARRRRARRSPTRR